MQRSEAYIGARAKNVVRLTADDSGDVICAKRGLVGCDPVTDFSLGVFFLSCYVSVPLAKNGLPSERRCCYLYIGRKRCAVRIDRS